MEPSAFAGVIKSLGGKFFSFMWPRIKNSKTFRDIKAKWTKDNYALKTSLLFEAAVNDAKAALDLPDDLICDLLEDSINREEIFRWILEGETSDGFDSTRLNLEPYWELYPYYEDQLVIFFELILSSIEEYKEIHWDPEFLEIISKITNLERITETGFRMVDEKQTKSIQIAEETYNLVKEFMMPAGSDDLSELIKQEKTITAREMAQERLRRGRLSSAEILELQSVIATTYIVNGQNREAIQHLYSALSNCENVARKHRLQAIIELLEGRLENALTKIEQAINIEGCTDKNLEILVNIYLQQREFDTALKIIDEHTDIDFEKLKAHVLQANKSFGEAIYIANVHLSSEPENIDWLVIKADSIILEMEDRISTNKAFNPAETLQQVMPLLDHILGRNIENVAILIRVKELKAALFFRNKRFAEAKLLYEDIYQSKGSVRQYFHNLLVSCIGDGDWERVIQLLEQERDSGHFVEENIIDLAKAYVEVGSNDKAIALLEANKQLLDQARINLSYFFTYIDALLLDLRHNDIKLLLQTLEKETSDIVHMQLLNAYYGVTINDWDYAINNIESCLESLVGADLIEAKLQLSTAYINRGTLEDYEKLTRLIVTIPNWMLHDFLVKRYVRALFEVGAYGKIISLSEQVPEQSPFLIDIISTIYFNLGWYEIAKTNYLSLYKMTGEFAYQLRYADCLFRLGNTNGALEVLNSAENRLKKNGTMENFSLMSLAFMDALQYRKAMEYAFLTYQAGKGNSEAWRFFFSQMFKLGQFVSDPDPNWVLEYQMMFEQFEKQFPNEEPPFKRIEAFQEGEISDAIIEELRRSKESSLQIRDIFEQNKLPLSFLVNSMNKGPFETWAHVVNERNMHVWVVNGDLQELLQGLVVAKRSMEILCDITTLLTIRHLGLLDMLKDRYSLYIHQDQYDLAFQEYSRTKLISNEGLKMIEYVDGRVVMSEYSSEQVETTVKNQEELLNWIQNNCTKIGNVIGDEQSDKNEKIAFLNNPIEVSKEHNLSMLVDSATIVRYAKQSYDVNSFTSIDLLNVLLDDRILEKEKYVESLGLLMMMGYTLLPISNDVFIYYLKKNNYKINTQVALLFDYLKEKEFNEDYVVEVVSKLLGWLWIAEVSMYERQQITDHICAVLCINKNKTDLIQKLILSSKTNFSVLVQHQWEMMKRCMEQWLEVQSII